MLADGQARGRVRAEKGGQEFEGVGAGELGAREEGH